MKHDFSHDSFRDLVSGLTDKDVCRVRYCYQVGSTFTAVAPLENEIINAMTICNKVQVETILNEDFSKWERFLNKGNHLRSSTLGNIIKLISRHSISPSDLRYLKWLKAKRDFFIHRYFHNGWWPGELECHEIERLCRTLGALEILFLRGAHRIYSIFVRAGLMDVAFASNAGMLLVNSDVHEIGNEVKRE